MIEVLKCSTCNKDQTTITDPESGEIICSNCGMVICERIEDTIHQEHRAYSSEEADKRDRIGAPTSLALHDMGLYAIIGRDNRDANGQMLDAAMRSKMERLRVWDSRIHADTSEDRSLRSAFLQLDKLKDKLGLSDAIVEKTAYIEKLTKED
jgi:transcription initiation factor TFIIB